MRTNRVMKVCLLSIALCTSCAAPDTGSAPKVTHSVLDVMNGVIVPASDKLWGVDDPQTDEAWAELAAATDILQMAFEELRDGGSGVNDKTWASDKRWQGHIDEELTAVRSSERAIEIRDVNALLEAGNSLYGPCASCHLDFTPGVKSNQ